MRVLICGGGVIGACIAYFLARRGVDVTVIERTEVLRSFRQSGWLSGARLVRQVVLDSLWRRSFALHVGCE